MKMKMYYDEHYKEKIMGIRTKYVECAKCIAYHYDCMRVKGTALKKFVKNLVLKKE